MINFGVTFIQLTVTHADMVGVEILKFALYKDKIELLEGDKDLSMGISKCFIVTLGTKINGRSIKPISIPRLRTNISATMRYQQRGREYEAKKFLQETFKLLESVVEEAYE